VGLTIDNLQLTFLPTSKSRDTKTRKNIRNPAGPNVDIAPSLRIRGQVPAPIENGEADSFGKWKDFQL